MTTSFLRRLSLFAFALAAFACPPAAFAKTAKPAAQTAAPDDAAAASSVTAPVAQAPAAAPAPPPVQPALKPTANTLKVGDLTVGNVEFIYKSDHIDMHMEIKNAGSGDERLGGADTTLKNTGIVEVTKDKDGKETETSVAEPLPAGKTVDFTAAAGKWLRIKGVESEPKAADLVTMKLFFRRSPNAVFRLPVGAAKSSSVLDWLKN